MPKFDVEQEVDELTYDFTKFVPDAKGVIPEPSNDQISEFRKKIVTLIPVTFEGGTAQVDVAALTEKYGNEEADAKALERELYQCVADLCSEHPTADQIMALPFRGQRAFVGFIVGTFLRPEA